MAEAVAIGAIVTIVVTVTAMLTSCLGAGRVGTPSDGLAIGDIVPVAEQAIDDVGDRIAIALLLTGVRIRLLRIALLWVGFDKIDAENAHPTGVNDA